MPADIKAIFLAATEKQPPERSAFLAEACGGDSALRARIEALLKAHDASGGWLGEPATPTSDYPGFTAPSVAELAARFPQLEIIELLGQGGMGAVYKARQKNLDRLVALKILPHETGDAGFAERFTREARTLAKLNHPGIVAVHDFGSADGLYWFVMEYVDGVNLRQAKRAGSLTPAAALAIVPQICEALQFAHDAGIVHRDIKPENVLLDAKGRIKIADFGLAKLLGRTERSHLTGTHQAMGTPHYMAPEQWERPLEVDHRADIYSLGVVFYELLTGELPLGRFAPPSQKVHVDVRLDEVVLKTLEKEPARRYQAASQIKAEVERIGSARTLPAPLRSGEQAGRSGYFRRAVFWPMMIVLLGGVLPLVIFALFPAEKWDRGVRDNIAAVVAIACWIGSGVFAFQTCRWFLDRRREGRARRIEAFGPPTSETFAVAQKRLSTPSCAMVLFGLATMLLSIGVVAWTTTLLVRIGLSPDGPVAETSGAMTVTTKPHPWLPYRPWIVVALIVHVAAAGIGGVIAFAGFCMRRMEHLAFAQAGSVLAMAPVSAVWPIGMCTGLWSFLTMNRPDVEAAFDRGWTPPEDPLTRRPSGTVVFAASACVLGFLATFMPWVLLRIFGVAITTFGFDIWNGLVAGLLFLACLLALIGFELSGADRHWKAIAMVVVGLVVALVGGEYFWGALREPQVTQSSGDSTLRPMVESFMLSNVGGSLSVGPFVSAIAAVALLGCGVVGLIRLAPRSARTVDTAVTEPDNSNPPRPAIATWIPVLICLAGIGNMLAPWLLREAPDGHGYYETDSLCGLLVGYSFLILGILLFVTMSSRSLRPVRAGACLVVGAMALGVTAYFLARTNGEIARLDAHYEKYLRGLEAFLPRMQFGVGPFIAVVLSVVLVLIGAFDLRGRLARSAKN